MDVTSMRIAATVACFVIFLGIVWWAYARDNRDRFAEAAQIPFDHD